MSSLGRPPKNILVELYVDLQQNALEISTHYGVSARTVNVWLCEAGIRRISGVARGAKAKAAPTGDDEETMAPLSVNLAARSAAHAADAALASADNGPNAERVSTGENATGRAPRGIEVQFRRSIGRELKASRRRVGHTQADLARRCAGSFGVTTQTVAAWELGNRAISVHRFVQLCAVLTERPWEVIERAFQSDFPSPDAMVLDLHALEQSLDPRLQGLRSWASVTASQRAERPAVTTVRRAQLPALAYLAGISVHVLAVALHDVELPRGRAERTGGDSS